MRVVFLNNPFEFFCQGTFFDIGNKPQGVDKKNWILKIMNKSTKIIIK